MFDRRMLGLVVVALTITGCSVSSTQRHWITFDEVSIAPPEALRLAPGDQLAVERIQALGGEVVTLIPNGSSASGHHGCGEKKVDPHEYTPTYDSGPKLLVRVPSSVELTPILAELATVDATKKLELFDRQVTDAQLKAIAKLPAVEYLQLDVGRASEKGVAPLAHTAGLRMLELRNASASTIQKQLKKFPSHITIENVARVAAAPTQPQLPPTAFAATGEAGG
jgi:hypothetical protein